MPTSHNTFRAASEAGAAPTRLGPTRTKTYHEMRGHEETREAIELEAADSRALIQENAAAEIAEKHEQESREAFEKLDAVQVCAGGYVEGLLCLSIFVVAIFAEYVVNEKTIPRLANIPISEPWMRAALALSATLGTMVIHLALDSLRDWKTRLGRVVNKLPVIITAGLAFYTVFLINDARLVSLFSMSDQETALTPEQVERVNQAFLALTLMLAMTAALFYGAGVDRIRAANHRRRLAKASKTLTEAIGAAVNARANQQIAVYNTSKSPELSKEVAAIDSLAAKAAIEKRNESLGTAMDELHLKQIQKELLAEQNAMYKDSPEWKENRHV